MKLSKLSPQQYMWCILLTIGMFVFLLNIDYTAVNLALLPIAEELKSDLNTLQWLLSGYVLTWGAVVVPAGRLADLYGRKKVLILGLTIFMLGSLLTGAGNHISFLIGGRILQGIGAAIFTAPGLSFVFMSAPPAQQGLAIGIMSSLGGFGLATGPTLAAWIIQSFGWRWIFYINIPFSLLVITVIFYLAPQDKTPTSFQLNKLNALLLSCGLGIVMFTLNQIEVWGMHDPQFWGLLLLGCTLLLIFALKDKTSSFQLFPHSLLKNKAFMSTNGAVFGTAYCFSLILVMIALYLQNTLKMTGLETGYLFLAMTLSVGILSPIGGKLVDFIDIRALLMSAFVLLFSALLFITFFSKTTSIPFILITLCLAGLGIGVIFPSLNTAMFRTLEDKDINTGSAIFVMCSMLGNTLAIIVSTSVTVLSARHKLTALLAHHNILVTSPQYKQLISIINKAEHTAQHLNGFVEDKITQLLYFIELAFLNGMKVTMWIGMGFTILSAILVCKFLKLKPTTSTSHSIASHF